MQNKPFSDCRCAIDIIAVYMHFYGHNQLIYSPVPLNEEGWKWTMTHWACQAPVHSQRWDTGQVGLGRSVGGHAEK